MTPTESGGPGFGPLLELASHGPDTYVGAARRYPFEGLYGGQVIAQALWAAGLTVKAGYVAHSLHAYFLRMGDPSEPVRFEVERLHDGRSFIARQVVARQSTGAILNMSASFQAVTTVGVEPLAPTDVQLARLPQVAPPEKGEDLSWSSVFELRLVRGKFGATGRWLAASPGHRAIAQSEDAGGSACSETGSDDLSGAGGSACSETGPDDLSGAGGPSCSWLKVRQPLPDEPAVHAAALAYESDSGPAWVVGALHETTCRPTAAWRPVSLDHAMWFHRPFRADDWLLVSMSASSLNGSRGLAQGQVFSREGALVASVSQEVLLRRPRPAEGGC